MSAPHAHSTSTRSDPASASPTTRLSRQAAPPGRWRIFTHAPAPGHARPARATPWSDAKAPVVRPPRHQ
eukprot:2391046-Pyramimonas_sp.AAC.1